MIGVKSAKWMERPLACVVLKEGETLSYEDLIGHLTPLMAKVELVAGGSKLHGLRALLKMSTTLVLMPCYYSGGSLMRWS